MDSFSLVVRSRIPNNKWERSLREKYQGVNTAVIQAYISVSVGLVPGYHNQENTSIKSHLYIICGLLSVQ